MHQLRRAARTVLLHQPRPVDIHRARADLQPLADQLAGQPVDQQRRDLALARGQLELQPALGRQVLEAPDAGRVRRARVECAAGHMAPEQLAGVRTADPLHDAVVGVAAAAVETGQDALAGPFELGTRGVEHLEAAADDGVARGAEHLEQCLVAVDHQALARDDEPDRRLVERNAVIREGRRGGQSGPQGLREHPVSQFVRSAYRQPVTHYAGGRCGVQSGGAANTRNTNEEALSERRGGARWPGARRRSCWRSAVSACAAYPEALDRGAARQRRQGPDGDLEQCRRRRFRPRPAAARRGRSRR